MNFELVEKPDPVEINPWQDLRKFTAARIALGRTGDSQPTQAILEFGLAHAQARDAVHVPMDGAAVEAQLAEAGFPVLHVHSAASDRREYLVRPDHGRKLSAPSRAALESAKAKLPPNPIDVVFVVADGLSAFAPSRHAVPLLQALRPRLEGWRLAPVVVALQSRVALGDEIGEILGAEMVVMLIGERPGLSSPDSLGIYLTYRPRVGRNDAERNCISNVRPGGLDFEAAAFKLHYLMENARRLQLSGVDLKDDSDALLAGGTEIQSLEPKV
jgi:ethanolamine ammonia-lyase small subunit